MSNALDELLADFREMEAHTVGGQIPCNPKILGDRLESAIKEERESSHEEDAQITKVKKPLEQIVGDMVVDAVCDGINNYIDHAFTRNYEDLNAIIKHIKAEWVAKKLQMEKNK